MLGQLEGYPNLACLFETPLGHRALLDLRVIPGKERDRPCLLPGSPVCHLGAQEQSWDDPRITGWSSNGHWALLDLRVIPGKWRDHPCLLPGSPVCHLGEQE